MSDAPGSQYGQPNQFPTGGGPTFDARSKVQGPAIGLIVTALVGIVLQILGAVIRLLGIGLGALGGERENALAGMIGGTVVMGLTVVAIIFGVVILLGALKMKNLESHGFAMVASILAMIPCISPCCLLGLPIGIWALVVLLDQNVKAAFRS